MSNTEADPPDRPRRGRGARSTSALALGSAVSGVLAYVFFALTTRALGAEAAAPVSVLWAYWGFAGAALTFPLQHWIARSVSAHGGEGHVRDGLRGVALAIGLVSLLAGLLSWLVQEQLFHRGDGWFPLLVVLVSLGSALMGVVRGSLTARGRFAAVGLGLVAENGLRCLVVAALMLAGVETATAYGLAMVLGYLAIGLWPGALRFDHEGRQVPPDSALAFLGGAAGGQLLGQVVLTGAPVLLALASGAPEDITALFAGLALFRAPYTLALGMVARLTHVFTDLVVAGRRDLLRRLRVWVLSATLAGIALAAAIGLWAGPWLIRLVFGADVRLAAVSTVLIAMGSAAALANLVVTVLLIAHGRTASLLRCWALSLLPGAAFFAWSGVPALERTCGTFLAVEVVALVLLVLAEVRAAARLGSAGLAGGHEDR